MLFPGFGADPMALLDKLSALTLMKTHPVPFTAKKRLFHLGRRFTSRQRSLLLGEKEEPSSLGARLSNHGWAGKQQMVVVGRPHSPLGRRSLSTPEDYLLAGELMRCRSDSSEGSQPTAGGSAARRL